MPKIVDHEQYRRELLSKCFDLFADKGYAAVTMREIAQSLEVSTGTLYHYFPSKKALFEQFVEELNQQEMAMAIAELEGTETLQAAMEALGRYLSKNEDYYIKLTYILVNFSQHQDSKEIWSSAMFKRIDQRCRQAIRDFLGIQDDALASFILCLIDGLILERLWGNEKISFTEQCTLLGQMLAAYLQEKPVNKWSQGKLSNLKY